MIAVMKTNCYTFPRCQHAKIARVYLSVIVLGFQGIAPSAEEAKTPAALRESGQAVGAVVLHASGALQDRGVLH
jgi:hypothetical protein